MSGLDRLARRLYSAWLRRRGQPRTQWCRVVMAEAVEAHLRALGPGDLDALEVSGKAWEDLGFRSYEAAFYPDFDLVAGPKAEAAWDVVLLEQVLEHMDDPAAALRHAHAMLRPGGTLYVSTPFLIKVHLEPEDHWRWTATGLARLLAKAGFDPAGTEVASWGNRDCVVANLDDWVTYLPGWDSLANDPEFPLVVWAFAQK